ncbi:MAG: tRNA adenosine(34) deaminase TadA [Gammaproteobacteria bacterium]|jgi:tRNA(adenine34) deaminase|nr:tRNA adenosine(34) deaminase TadA [Gammaproteobacteria bacterium]
MTITQQDQYYIEQALNLAQTAYDQHEVPVGALVVLGDKIIGEGWNQPISSHDPTAHAEIVALRNAAQYLRNYRLPETTLYVTLEPCTMCVGAMIHARIQRLVFGAFDPKTGSVQSVSCLLDAGKFNHRIAWVGGCKATTCGELLQKFFKARRFSRSI